MNLLSSVAFSVCVVEEYLNQKTLTINLGEVYFIELMESLLVCGFPRVLSLTVSTVQMSEIALKCAASIACSAYFEHFLVAVDKAMNGNVLLASAHNGFVKTSLKPQSMQLR